MNRAMKHLAVLLALALCLNVACVAAADGDEDMTTPDEVIVEQNVPDEPDPEPDPEPEPAAPPKEEPPEAEKPAPQEPQDDATDEPDEQPEQSAPVEDEADGDSEQEPTPAPKLPEKETPAPEFSAKARIRLVGQETVALGDIVTLRADVEEANGDYVVVWQFFDVEADILKGEDPWVDFAEGEEYVFEVTEENVDLTYRVVLNDKIRSRTFSLENLLESDEPEQTPDADADAQLPEDEQTPGEQTPDGEIGEAEPDAETPDEDEQTPDDEDWAPQRSIHITADWGEGELHYGAKATLTAVLVGYDDMTYTVQWQTSRDGESWEDIADATGESYVMTVTEENCRDFWRVVVTATPDAE